MSIVDACENNETLITTFYFYNLEVTTKKRGNLKL